ncbi:MAG: phosphatase PAP2 family protein [Succinivibrio sp.]|nr:phosphatase PAP2 family protein [Succinivibrio sp.]
MATKLSLTLCVLAAACLTGCTQTDSAGAQNSAAQNKAVPFLTEQAYPDPLKVLPAPPKQGSYAHRQDEQIYKQTRSYKGTPLWEEAARADKHKPNFMLEYFSKAMGMELSKSKTPATYALIRQLERDAMKSTAKSAKEYFKRVRPFVVYKQRTCSTPENDESHRTSWSYPSSHATLGWLMAMVLSELNPERQNELLSLGYQYGQNRVICGFHWQSDVDAGRLVAGYALARLHGDENFRQALELARKELAALKQADR